MSASIGQSIDAVCKEKGIDRDVVIEAVKEAVRAAARKQFKSGEEIRVEGSPESGLKFSPERTSSRRSRTRGGSFRPTGPRGSPATRWGWARSSTGRSPS